MEHYFAYGSNLEQRRMLERCPSARPVGHAILQGYRLDFPLSDKNWRGGVAGVLRDKKAQVEGIVYELTLEDLEALDRFEDVALGDYFRKKQELEFPDGTPMEAWVYFPGRYGKNQYPPSEAYKAALVSGAIEHGLSERYVRFLKSISVNTEN